MTLPPSELDLSGNDAPVCPYCGHEEKDPGEVLADSGAGWDTTNTCGACDREYRVHIVAQYTFDTSALEEAADGHPQGEAGKGR